MSKIKRSGHVIGVKPGMLERYIEIHNNQPDEIRDLLYKSGCVRCDIFTFEIEGKSYLFQYLVQDEDAEVADLSLVSAYDEWARITKECQLPLPGTELWKKLDCIYTLKKNEIV